MINPSLSGKAQLKTTVQALRNKTEALPIERGGVAWRGSSYIVREHAATVLAACGYSALLFMKKERTSHCARSIKAVTFARFTITKWYRQASEVLGRSFYTFNARGRQHTLKSDRNRCNCEAGRKRMPGEKTNALAQSFGYTAEN